jgi:type III pantothenate kinase
MLLAIDVGNTNIKFGLHDATGWRKTWRILTLDLVTNEYIKPLGQSFLMDGLAADAVDGVVIASVVPEATQAMADWSERYLKLTPLLVDAGLETSIHLRVDNPHSLGADRIANAVAAKTLFGAPVIVVDCGTATKWEAIDTEGTYLGGAIASGAGLGSSALAEAAALLWEVALAVPPSGIGRSTVQAMQSGLFWGHVAMIEGMVARFGAELGMSQPRVIVTGGFATLFAQHTASIDKIAPMLTLDGLRILWALNVRPMVEY